MAHLAKFFSTRRHRLLEWLFGMADIEMKGVKSCSQIEGSAFSAALIEEYVARALPVGSRTLTERYKLGVSPATVRTSFRSSKMRATSRNPIPPQAASRPISGTAPSWTICSQMIRFLTRSATERSPEDPAQKRLGTRFAPRADLERPREAYRLPLDCPRADGPRDARQADHAREPYGVSRYLRCRDRRRQCLQPSNGLHHPRRQRRAFAHPGPAQQGTLREIALRRGTRPVVWHEARLLRSARARSARRGALRIQEGQTGRTHQLGMSALLAQPEFSHTDAVLPLVQVLEDDTVLLHILDDLTSTDEDLSVQIGKENKTEGLSGVVRCGEPLRTRRGGRRCRRHRADANGLFEGYPSRACGKRGAWRIVMNWCGFGEPLTKVVEKGKRWPRTCMRFSACRGRVRLRDQESVSSPRTRAAPRREQSCRR